MAQEDENLLPDDFEGTEEERLQLENDLLKLKMQADAGVY